MRYFVFSLMTLVMSTALAYKDGEFKCQSGIEGVPPRTVKISTVEMSNGLSAPYMEVTRYFFRTPGQPDSGVTSTTQRGFANHVQTEKQSTLFLAATRVDFVNDEIQNCKQ